ncbi:hypothetical protein ACP275_05G094900 [Erythranthe tilingii]
MRIAWWWWLVQKFEKKTKSKMEEQIMEEYDDDCTSFTVYEVDLDYEFDAARFFDFSRAESPLELRLAEFWFISAGSYPDSPFLSKLVSREEENPMENISTSPKSKGAEDDMDLLENSDIEVDQEISDMGMNYRGFTFVANNVNSKPQQKKSVKPSFSRTSTLMKPTASQLAKQRHPLESRYSRSHRSVLEKTNKSSTSFCDTVNQAAKRQKLEGGLLMKVEGAQQLQQTNFVHKTPKRDGLLVGSTPHTIPRITTPIEPELKTAHRAQRTRPKSNKEAENVASVFRKFKARPLNRKILEAPPLFPKRSTPHLPDFQEFHLKTSERAIQHRAAVPSDNDDKALRKYATNITSGDGNRGTPRSSENVATRPEGFGSSRTFKTLSLNKKILGSKAFNFQMEKKSRSNPPTELFSKLSLASDTLEIANFESKLPRSIILSMEGSKENRW